MIAEGGGLKDSLSLTQLIMAGLSIVLFGFLLWYFSDVVVFILVSGVLAVMFRPFVKFLSELKYRGFVMPRSVAALLTLFVIWAVCAIFIFVIFPMIANKMHQLVTLDLNSVLHSIEEPILYVQHYVQRVFSLPESDFSVRAALLNWGQEFFDDSMINTAVSSAIALIGTSVIAFFSMSFITFYFLKDDNLFFTLISGLFPSRHSESVQRALNSVSFLLSRYFLGLLGESIIVGSAATLVLFCFGMPFSDAIFIGFVMGLLNVIPYAGPSIGMCISIFIGLVSPIEYYGVGMTVLIVICTLLVIKGLDDFVLQPTLYSERVKAHPLEVFIVILLSGYVAGIIGMLLAIPSYTVIRVFAKEFFSQFSLVRRLTKEL